MKKFLRSIFIDSITLAFTAAIFPGLSYSSDVMVLLVAALLFTIINIYIKPIIKLLLLPINLLTLGMFRWLSGVFCLLLLTFIIPSISIRAWEFNGLNFEGFVIPQIYFSPVLSLIVASLIISLLSSFIWWLFKK